MASKKKSQKVQVNRSPGKPGRPSQITINSLQDLNVLHQAEMSQQKTRGDKLAALLTTNIGATDLIRTEFLRFLLDGPRDIDAECGYPAWLTPEHYRAMYDREGHARRVVECFPEESWAMDPELYEDEDPQNETDFETAWGNLLKQHNVWSYLKRFDILSGIGQYGILLMGIDDGKDMRDPVDNLNDDGTWNPPEKQTRLLYLRPFSEEVVFVKTRETDTNSPRYGLPTRYTIQFRDFPNWGIQAGEIIARDVHWSRCIHFADNKKQSEVYGIPRMQPVYNRLYDLRKIYACSGEAYWKGGFPGLVFEVNPEIADQGIELDKESMRKEFERYQAGLQRYLAVTGVTTKSLPPQFVDPNGPAEAHLKAIAIALGIPYRILFGSEEAKLAADQDSRAWLKRVNNRQDKTVNPLVIRPFVDRCIVTGILPPPESGEYEIEWPDLNSPTDQDKAQVALTRTQAMQGYILGNVSQLIPPDVYLEKELGYTPDEIENIVDAAQQQAQQEQTPESENEEDQEQGEGQENDDDNEGNLASSSVPDQGNALLQKDLDGSTTIPPKGKRVDATFVEQPSLNTGKGGQAKARPFVANEGEGGGGDTPDDGHWVTVDGHHVFIKDGEVAGDDHPTQPGKHVGKSLKSKHLDHKVGEVAGETTSNPVVLGTKFWFKGDTDEVPLSKDIASKVTQEDKAAVGLWHDGWYEAMRGMDKDGGKGDKSEWVTQDTNAVTKNLNQLKSALAKLPSVGGEVFRGLSDVPMENAQAFRSEKTITLGALSSFSVAALGARQFVDGNAAKRTTGVLFDFKTKGMKDMRWAGSEGEVLGQKGQTFKITGTYWARGGGIQTPFLVVEGEEVSSANSKTNAA